ncbi:hypothetical protein [Pseudoduganella sp. HUAS MS19]
MNDLEVYVWGPTRDTVIAAIESVVGAFTAVDSIEDMRFYKAGEYVLTVQPSYGDSTSYYLCGCDWWRTDVEFARFLAKEVGGKILCDPGATFPEISPYSDIFLAIENGKETLVEIRD